jgi:hypothetical protein
MATKKNQSNKIVFDTNNPLHWIILAVLVVLAILVNWFVRP